jgi:hypothetical protein
MALAREDRMMVPKCRCGCYLYAFKIIRCDKRGQILLGLPDLIVQACRLCDGDLVDRLSKHMNAQELRTQDGSA